MSILRALALAVFGHAESAPEKVEGVPVRAHVRKRPVNEKQEAVNAELRAFVALRASRSVPTEPSANTNAQRVAS